MPPRRGVSYPQPRPHLVPPSHSSCRPTDRPRKLWPATSATRSATYLQDLHVRTAAQHCGSLKAFHLHKPINNVDSHEYYVE
jgi:hypothetical protein